MIEFGLAAGGGAILGRVLRFGFRTFDGWTEAGIKTHSLWSQLFSLLRRSSLTNIECKVNRCVSSKGKELLEIAV